MRQPLDKLPDNASPFEVALAQSIDAFARLVDDYEGIALMRKSPPPTFLPHLLWELGLGHLLPYVDSPYTLLKEGPAWQRKIGVPRAIAMALRWAGYAGTLQEEPVTRSFWNLVQWRLDRVRDRDRPDLKKIADLIQMSLGERSKFTRGHHGYDVRAFETSRSRTSNAMWSCDSGVRIDDLKPLWSFGREWVSTFASAEADLTALGAWSPPPAASPLWAGNDQRWSAMNYRWSDEATQARRNAICEAVGKKRVHLRLREESGAIIGHRLAVIRPVVEAFKGEYTINGTAWTAATAAPTAYLILARTGFGDGAGKTAKSASVVFDGALTDASRPGALWLGPSGLSGGAELYSAAINVPLGETVRDRFIHLVRI